MLKCCPDRWRRNAGRACTSFASYSLVHWALESSCAVSTAVDLIRRCSHLYDCPPLLQRCSVGQCRLPSHKTAERLFLCADPQPGLVLRTLLQAPGTDACICAQGSDPACPG